MKLLFVFAIVLQATFIYSATIQDGSIYKIKAKGLPLVVGVRGDSNNFAARLDAVADSGSNYQRFEMHQVSGNVYHILIKGSGFYISNYISPPVQADFQPTFYYQDYELIPAAGGYYMIRPVANANAVLTVAQDGSLSWQTRTGADNQLFFFCRAAVTQTIARKFATLRAASLTAQEDEEILDIRSENDQ